jgi:hypothetical protein
MANPVSSKAQAWFQGRGLTMTLQPGSGYAPNTQVTLSKMLGETTVFPSNMLSVNKGL